MTNTRRRGRPKAINPPLSEQREYAVWAQLIQRCHNPNDKAFPRYGGRGISVDPSWRHGDGKRTGYEAFIADMGRRPSEKHTIERVDNGGNYERSNCVWATRLEQAQNRRDNLKIQYNGQTMSMSAACRMAGIKRAAPLHQQARGLNPQAAFEFCLTKDPRTVAIAGKMMTPADACRHLGIKRTRYQWWRSQGFAPQDALEKARS